MSKISQSCAQAITTKSTDDSIQIKIKWVQYRQGGYKLKAQIIGSNDRQTDYLQLPCPEVIFKAGRINDRIAASRRSRGTMRGPCISKTWIFISPLSWKPPMHLRMARIQIPGTRWDTLKNSSSRYEDFVLGDGDRDEIAARRRENRFSRTSWRMLRCLEEATSYDCGRSITSVNESAVSYVISATCALLREATNPDEQSKKKKKKKMTSWVRRVGKISLCNSEYSWIF